MMDVLKICTWNANGLCAHVQELRIFLTQYDIDVMLISETHFTDKSYAKIPGYTIYSANHPDGRAHGGSAVIIKNKIQHYEGEHLREDYLQGACVHLKDVSGLVVTVASVYCPPRHNNKSEQYGRFLGSLGSRFIAGGDYNAKSTMWGSRLTTCKGRELMVAINDCGCSFLSGGDPTYWPTDTAKVPDLLDFFVTKGIDGNRCETSSLLDLSSDHTPVLLTLHEDMQMVQKPPSLSSKRTNWAVFRDELDALVSLEVPLKTAEERIGEK